MALVISNVDNVKETSTTTGTGTLDLDGAVDGFQTFVAIVGNGNTCYYTIRDPTNDAYEAGLGTVTDATPDTLSRTTVYQSTNGDALVNFLGGTLTISIAPISSRMLQRIADGSLDMETKPVLGGLAAGDDLTLQATDDAADGDIIFKSDPTTERARITSGGIFLLGTTVVTGAGAGDWVAANANRFSFIRASGTTSSNTGMELTSGDDMRFHVPGALKAFEFRFNNTERLSISAQHSGGRIEFVTESTADHDAPAANAAKVYTKDNGSGKTQLVARFATGAIQVLATEP